MTDLNERQQSLKKLNELMKGIEIAMLTTAEPDGTLRSRPMGTQKVEFDGTLWFFTYASSAKVDEIQREQHVNVSYANPDDQVYISVSGLAQLVRDRRKMEELWNPALKTWFPKGLDEPDIALLKVDVTQAEYWDAPSSAMVMLGGFIKSQLTGKPPSPGDNQKLDLERGR